MAAAALTLALTFVAAGGIWLGLGAKFRLNEDEQVNDLLNLILYYALCLPAVFAVIFTVIG